MAMANLPLKRYKRRADIVVTAIQLNLETAGLSYYKWGSRQIGKPGDWLVENAGNVYTVDKNTFLQTYKMIEKGRYIKVTPVWASVATSAGAISTKEGKSHYQAGDILVFNQPNGEDGYSMRREKFEMLYEPEE